VIVEREGCSIQELFATRGEDYFRRCEAAALAEQADTEQTIFATGGGIVGRAENRERMKQVGRVVYLHASWPTLQKRIAKGSGRPLANRADGWDAVQRLWQSRLPWYEEADLVIDTDRLRVNEVVREIITRLGMAEAER
jgi:shikimate kinase